MKYILGFIASVILGFLVGILFISTGTPFWIALFATSFISFCTSMVISW